MLDLTSTVGSDAPGLFTGFHTSRDGKTGGGIIYDLTLSFEVRDEPDAGIVDKLLRGTRSYFEAVKDSEARGALKHAPVDMTGRLVLVHVESAVQLCDVVAEVRQVQVVKGARTVAYNVYVRIRGLDAQAAAHFAEHSERTLTVHWEATAAQIVLPFASPAATNAVQVVSARDDAGHYVFGVQTGITDDRVLLDDFGTAHEVAADQVISKNIFAPEHGASGPPLADVVAPYVAEIRAAGAVPSWKHFILGVATERAVDDLGAGVYKLTEAECRRAVEVGQRDVAN